MEFVRGVRSCSVHASIFSLMEVSHFISSLAWAESLSLSLIHGVCAEASFWFIDGCASEQ